MTANASGWRSRAGSVALAATLALLALAFAKLLAGAALALGYPYDLDYGEGIVWQQMDAIAAGRGYASLGTFPAIVFHYPPVYHLVVAVTAATAGLDALVAGRLVSLSATVAAMGLAGCLCLVALPAGTGRQTRMAAAAAAALAFAASPTVGGWASLMRVDLLATALTLAGLLLTARALRTPRRMPWVAILFVLAAYTKQTTLIAPLAAFVTLWLAQPRAAWRFLAVAVALGGIALGAMMVVTDGQFLRHVVGYNVNRLDPDRWHLIARVLASQVVTLAVAAIVAVRIMLGWGRAWRGRIAATPVEATRFLLILYAALRIATIPLALKSGANENYFIDLFSVAAILLGLGVADVAAAIRGHVPWPRALLTLLVLVALPVQAARVGTAHAVARDTRLRAYNDALAARMRAATKPILTDYMVLLRRSGKPVRVEPAIVAELAPSGLYDERGYAALIRARTFAFVLTQGADKDYRERYNPAVRAAIESAYPCTESFGEAVLRLPSVRPCADPAPSPRG